MKQLVERYLAFDIRDLWFESSHQQILSFQLLNIVPKCQKEIWVNHALRNERERESEREVKYRNRRTKDLSGIFYMCVHCYLLSFDWSLSHSLLLSHC